jgi:Tol biopolymer transport system component
VPNQGGLWVIGPDGAGPHALVTRSDGVEDASFSSDGRRLVYTVLGNTVPGDDVFDMYMVNVDGTNNHEVVRAAHNPTGPSWSPDGSSIAFLDDDRNGNRGLYVTDGSGSTIRPLAPVVLPGGALHWSPDSKRIAYGGSGINIITVSTGAQRTVGGFAPWDVSWAADSRHLAFGLSGRAGAYVISDDGTDARQVHPHAAAAVWSPNGAGIALDLDGITLCTPAGTMVSTLASAVNSPHLWAPDSSMISGIGAHDEGIVIGHVDLRPALVLVGNSPQFMARDLAWAPDSRSLVFTTRTRP